MNFEDATVHSLQQVCHIMHLLLQRVRASVIVEGYSGVEGRGD